MLVDSIIAFLAFGAVIYSICGEPRKNRRFTWVGKSIIAIALFALVFTLIKSWTDDSEKRQLMANTREIPALKGDLATLSKENQRIKKQNDEILRKLTEAAQETQKLESAIRAIFARIRVENDQLILSYPEFKTIKAGPMKTKVPIPKNVKIRKDVRSFQKQMNGLEREMLGRVDEIKNLFDSLTK